MSRYPYYEVQFLNDKGDLVKKEFDSLYKCRLFVLRCKLSRRVTLVSYPRGGLMSAYPYYVVQFIDDKGDLVKREFNSLYKCRLFVLECKHSRRVTLVSYPMGI